jgi:DNA-binding response OmpR family regulator
MIAKSRRLIASVGRFMSPAKKLDQCWTAAENRADISPREPGFEPTAVQRVIRTGRLVVDLNAQLAAIYDRPLQLTKKEYAVLELLSLRKGTIVSREMLLDRLYGGTNEPEMKIVDEFVSKLREKIAQANGGNHYIETVWERGFVLNDSPQLRSAASPRSGLTDIVSSTQRQN